VQVFGEWMNVPPHWVERLHASGRAFILAVNLNQPEAMKETSLTLYAMARELIALRKAEPLDSADDITSALLASQTDGKRLEDELIVGMVRQVLVVGIVALTVLMGSIAIHLSRDQDLQQELRANPVNIPAAVENSCGFTRPIAASPAPRRARCSLAGARSRRVRRLL
jgi:cytochrome P450